MDQVFSRERLATARKMLCIIGDHTNDDYKYAKLMNYTTLPQVLEIRRILEEGPGILRVENAWKRELEASPAEWFLGLTQKIGTPLSQSATGELILSVRNESFGQDDQRTRGPNTNRKLGFHTDRCDAIAFLCLQPAKSGGENQVVKSEEVEKRIRDERPDLHELLCKPFPYKRHVVDKANALPYCLQPIFSWKKGFFACSYLRVLIDRADRDAECPSLTNAQREALDFMDQVCEQDNLQNRFTMKSGDLLFLNNWITLHRRTVFEDHEDVEKRRHLLRVWLSMPNSRPIDDAFKSNFGSVKAGAVRGGMNPMK